MVAERGAALHSNRRICRIHMDRPHLGKIDHQAIVTKGPAADIVPAATDRRQQTVRASEIQSVHDIRHP
jgi:hypothetical protein